MLHELKKLTLETGPADEQKMRRDRFWKLVEGTGLRRWSPGQAFDSSRRLLVGIAPGYSLPDIDLAESLIDLAARRPDISVDVFDVSDLGSKEDLAEFIPGLKAVFHTPIAAVWEKGVVMDVQEGSRCRSLIRKISERPVPMPGE
jgi:hypothetical protein